MSITLNGTTGIIADSPATVKANAFLDAAGGNTATINGAVPASLASPALTGTPTAPTATVGTNTTQIATTAFVLANGAFTKSFESSQQTITAAGALTLAHSLGATPKLIAPFLVCISADLGFSIGDVVLVNPANNSVAASAYGQAISYDATNVYVRYASSVGVYQIITKDTGASATITSASWKFIVRAYA